MTIPEKCEAIIKKIIELANEGKSVTIEEDFGDWTATIFVGNAHTHVGIPGNDPENYEILINNLYNSLHDGPGLSWA